MEEHEDIIIQVRNPRTHVKKIWMSFTDYEIRVLTRNRAFMNQNSSVRRRYSEVAWLKRTLGKCNSLTSDLPPFPNKKVFGNRFSQGFIEDRRASLEQFLTRLVNTTTCLSEAALHLFLQTNLTTKEIERIIEGKDSRDVTHFVFQESEMFKKDILRRRSTANTNTDSGFSGSTNYDMNLTDNVSDCQMAGNGWSSGCTNFARNKKSYKGPCYSCRRKSLSQAASVLPSGQLLMATGNQKQENETASGSSSERCPEESCTKCNQYDADDETDNHALDYDIINIKTLRLRNWLSTVKAFSDTELITSDDECEQDFNAIPEYDVISVPCLNSSIPSLSLQSTLVRDQSKVIKTSVTPENNKSDDSEYSVVHSTIGGLELGTSKQLYDSSSSLSSAGVYRTYDVVEMVEVL
ncbi:uncharacterized protein LOC110248740 [Exaiptasia diaphana]|uniref:PX domain-containing protein n=1 Tax=Exaiptasia diaphana TaxID=2652724 RepID=A0A913XWJ4_EXADI|nr:uncharacterized protein LOC110248740 [Exaiptasia diaphana]